VTLIEHACAHGHRLVLIDSSEMLDLLPEAPCVTKSAGRFPLDHREFVTGGAGAIDVIIVYSVLQYVLAESNLLEFLDSAVSMLAHGGQLLAGDIPNESMRARFAMSPSGAEYRRKASAPAALANDTTLSARRGTFHDDLIVSLLARYRAAGYHAYVMPQAADLPMADRREDLLIVRP
jgi:hypothetical protein